MSEAGSIPHFFQVYANFKATCTCRNFKPKQICSHSVAVTEKEGVLDKFVTWYKGQKIKGGLSSAATINIDTRASGRKQGPKRQRKTRENVDFSLLMSSSFRDMKTTSATSSSTSSASLGATSSATVPISQTAIQQPFDSTSFPSILAQTQSQLNDLASHSSTNQLLYRGTDLQPQHQTFPLTGDVSHVPTAMGGAVQHHPFRYLGKLQQSFTTSMFSQRLSPAMSSTQQHSFSGMRPPSVPQGFPLPPRPIILESSNHFFLMKLKRKDFKI